MSVNTVAALIVGLMSIAILGVSVIDTAEAKAPEAEDAATTPHVAADVHSFGNLDQVRVRHIALDLTVDIEHRILHGTAVLDFVRQPGCPADAPLVLDSRGLTIEHVWLGKSESTPQAFTPTTFVVDPADLILGSRLTIKLSPSASQVRIAYKTIPTAGALQWLEPALTAGKVKPFLFTQSQAIHARSWIPLQDSPAVRVTYVANIRVPKGLTAVMAAESRSTPGDASQGLFHFAMTQPIPSYLIALAVGDLAFQPLGKRTGVWAEPSVLKAAAYEFADVEKMVESAEKQFGPYRWGRYDILVLPPSFPFGGMENPRLTFATPTVLAGDRSLVSLIAHELAHSWSGNLVTNATWRDFWLNEGFTTYIERRIVEDIYGRDQADMEAVLGMRELREELGRLPEKDQILHVDLNGRDPDDGMTQIPYEKGALFLRTLEQSFGRARFDAFLRAYFDEHVFQSITTADFVVFLRDRLLSQGPLSSPSIDVDAWLARPGLPPGFADPKSSRLTMIDQVAKRWLLGSVATGNLGAGEWSTQEWLRFLQGLPDKLSLEKMTELDQTFGLTARGNSETAHQWLLMSIRNGYKPADPRLESYLNSIGRRKLVLPLYRALLATPEGRERAHAIYAKARQTYHPITVDSIDRLMKETK
jgi:leukotriene-A4 hydrolase